MVQKKILKPIKAKDIFDQKDYLDFNLSIPVANGSCIASDFIFNTLSYNKLLYDEETFPHIIGKKGFEIISRIYDEAGKSIFKDGYQKKLKQIPDEYTNPPIHISSYNFRSNLGFNEDKLMTMLSLHSPLNITLDSMIPFATFFNPYLVSDGFSKFLLFFSRIPIFVAYGKQYYVTNLWQLFNPKFVPLNSFFSTEYSLIDNFYKSEANKTITRLCFIFSYKIIKN